LNVKEYEVGLAALYRLNGLTSIATLRYDLHIVCSPQQRAKSAPSQILIVHYECSDAHAGSASGGSAGRAITAWRNGMRMTTAKPPPSLRKPMFSCAVLPYNADSRSLELPSSLMQNASVDDLVVKLHAMILQGV
jgi:hypothetical protein